ncbi:stage V sporulation protein AC [Anaerosalibacter bizertensis]|uniref:Stage V sporulation protein AC n=1 Tax=Anaerosalibacter bizertensis TaxID=932217 RepID=A0A844FGQ7_9FIRM|nr:stage V sporulation protein AC [Anaerosalibacter bizertensis]MBV1817902.1 stage V sporulation protein AC [Bacteroidales bacterium MSK.15.36]HHV25955.1 stage V sporulation protein AC [Tissierellia bacterium]MBU5293861.1 stage V sporulation protein AC [Anaerosalibacter bizertensis]MCB5559479.1 stage V sporulation protein AC [Anaerosalibacter bizertensis]MCG4564737.1 stage V sporulation protein AC [Anaerosalibacter bizertensis]
MDRLNKKEYEKYADKKIPKPTYFKNIFWAFVVGGLICTIGQLIRNWLFSRGLNEKQVAAGTSITLVFIGSFLTGIGVYDRLGKVAGAGSAVPITGFANSIVSPAMEHKREGYIFGVAAKMFIIAGPVLVYGVGSSILVGIVYLLFGGGR